MMDLEIPIIARVNGDAIGFGQSLMLACDLIVAREDARIPDVHLSLGEIRSADDSGVVGPQFGTAPGDGAGALIPLYMSPPLAKEYLMLSRVRTGAEMAGAGVINRAVPMSELDAAVNELVAGLLARPPYAIGWTKRIVNSRVRAQLNRSLDASAAYEMLNFVHFRLGGAPGAYSKDPDAEE
jgi:enoyl-CoA hydratase/carnithine racemase